MLKLKNYTFYLLFSGLCLLNSGILQAQEPTWELAQPKYETVDAFVYGFNVMDHGADPTGTTDQTRLFQSLLDILGTRSNGRVNDTEGNKIGAQANRNGGVLYVPEGKYLFTGSLTLPKGVTIRGDWEKPVKGQPVKGTILMPTRGRENDVTQILSSEGQSFIIMQPSTAVINVNIWYPEQDPNDIVPYPPAILFGSNGYWGNEYCLASNITLVNAFDGVIFSRRNGGGAPNCYGIYGTPLRRGIEIDNIAEVGRIDNVDFSPDYWAGSGLPGAPSVNGPHKEYIRENGTAVVMRRNDWSFACKVKAEGYNKGYHLGFAYNDQGSPNGHNYGMEFTDCKYGVYAEAVAGAGMMFYEYKFTDCDYGFYFVDKPGGVAQIQACEFDTKIAAIYAPETNNTKILINQCTFNKGPVDIRGGVATIVNNDFNAAEARHIALGEKSRAIVTGNRFSLLRYFIKGEPNIKNGSIYECYIDHTPIEMETIPHFPYKNQYDFVQKPSGTTYFLATAHGVSVDADDNSEALQALLDQVGTAGGGLVFLPPGRYNFRQSITIPTGVELKGSVDVPSVPMGPGSVMQIYWGKDDPQGTPFINMEERSGIRGLVMNYPEQKIQLLTEPGSGEGDVHHYSYTIRGNKDTYIVNIGLRACYQGVDLFTNKCDNHFVDYLAGHVFRVGVRVGGGTKGGHIYNSQFNQIAYGSGGETKFGAWPNSPDNDQADKAKYSREHTAAYAYCWNHLDFIVLEDCEDQIMYNNFDFGSNRGFVLAGASGMSLGQGIDQGMKAFYIEAVGKKGFNFINSQIVTTPANSDVKQEYKDSNRYIQVDDAFAEKVTFFGADFWGQAQIAVEVPNGTIEMQAGNWQNPGQRNFASVAGNGMFDVIGSNINNINSLLTTGSAPQFFIQSSFVNVGNTNIDDCGLWLYNMPHSASVYPDAEAFLPNDGWIVTASVNNEESDLSIDRDASTRWSTLTDRQKPGQWFMVDMRETQTFTGIYLDPGTNSNFMPENITVSISDDGENWKDIASGDKADLLLFDVQQARYIKITQNGTSISYSWRIAEFYVMNSDLSTSIKNPQPEDNIRIRFNGSQLSVDGLEGQTGIKVYSVSGQLIKNTILSGNSIRLDMPKGIYIVSLENKGKFYRKKVLKQ